MRTKQEELLYINQLQDLYVDELIHHIELQDNAVFKECNLTAPTGSGKTVMMAKLINKKPEWFFIVTTISHGQLHKQVEKEIRKRSLGDNYEVYGVSSFTRSSILTSSDILNSIPRGRKIIWLRDEGHRHTNRWMELLEDICDKIVNISATNESDDGVLCNFTDTMMLRTVSQCEGDYQDAVRIFKKVQKDHEAVANYTPCILFRVTNNTTADEISNYCIKQGISYINLVGFDDYDMTELCDDCCTIEAIIYMQKMDLGIDIRRAHVIWLQTKPNNIRTTIQCVGRCRRNALFWRDDIDILSADNKRLLAKTRVCYAVYKIEGSAVDTNEIGEMVSSFCPYISVQKLRPETVISVKNGVLPNGLHLIELERRNGTYHIYKDKNTGFNVVDNPVFYRTETKDIQNHILDPRLEPFFVSPNNVESEIRKIYDRFKTYPHAEIKFGYLIPHGSVLKKSSSSTVFESKGFYKQNIVYSLEEIGIIRRGVSKKKEFYNSVTEFVNDILINYLRGVDCLAEIDHLGHVQRESAFELIAEHLFWVQVCKGADFVTTEDVTIFQAFTKALKQLNIQKEDASILIQKYPGEDPSKKPAIINAIKRISYCDPRIQLSKEQWYDVFHKMYPPEEFILHDPEQISPDTLILKCGKYYYTFAECSNIAIHGSVKPEIPQYYQITDINQEMAIIGAEKFRLIEGKWYPVRSVTELLGSNTKFHRFISQRYGYVIDQARPFFYKKKNNFNFDKRQNSCLGFCVEYYAKALLYNNFISINVNDENVQKAAVLRACIERYKEMMIRTFGTGVAKRLSLPTKETLGSEHYKSFTETCTRLGEQTHRRLMELLCCEEKIECEYDTSLSTKYLCGLMDVVSHDTIIDIKVTSQISEKMLLQVLSYHYLSTYRSDLVIDRVALYDAALDRYLLISGLKNNEIKVEANYSII